MIYENAETAQDIADILRGRSEVVKQKIMANKVTAKLLGVATVPGVIITAPRQSGKTTELLRYAEEKYGNNSFCVVCFNQAIQVGIIRRHWELFNAGNITKRLMGQTVESWNVSAPLMLNPDNLHLLKGQSKPVFVDEWNLIPVDSQDAIIESGLFIAAVTS